ncbi:DNA helicase [Achromobacter phage JWAlpha]|uniref:DNA helicase n=1 Tax=Achromobacter phage JWAlpha TaxID=1416009 RepID=V9VCX0_9CAUD|nr:DNA helicase [Achromobacter phage JWAlpha]AHC94007.1 DNA helicase [Achromobacter phage JWAlpha]
MDKSTTTKPLNADQQAAAEGFFKTLFDPNVKEMNISGPGGVGKTYLMAHIVDEVMPQYHDACGLMGVKPEFDEVVMTATTNKAAEILAQSTSRPTSTIQSHLGLTIKNNFRTGESDLIKSRNWSVKERQIIFVDEASMIDSKLRSYIQEGQSKSKIVYVGDHCQLPPIKEGISPVYNNNLPMFQLLIPMRTDRPELLALNQQYRDIVEGKRDFGDIKTCPGVIDHVGPDEMEALLKTHFDGPNKNRVVAYSNKQVLLYTDHIRDQQGFRGEFDVGEELVVNQMYTRGMDRMSIEQEVSITKRSSITRQVRIDADVYMEVRSVDLDTGYGGTLTDVEIPVDREYHAALVKYYAREKNWERHFYLKESFPDLRAKDACTVHKSQGSSYDTVFIDLGDLSTCHNPSVAARLFYVAFSRARHRVVMYGELAEKYGRIV